MRLDDYHSASSAVVGGLSGAKDAIRVPTLAEMVFETGSILADVRGMLDDTFGTGGPGCNTDTCPSGALYRVREVAESNREAARAVRSAVERLVSELR